MGSKDKNLDIIYYGALLHDIGKFLWRIRSSTSFNHAKLGAEFVKGIKSKINQFPIEDVRETLATVIENHHEKDLVKIKGQEPAYSIARLISFADRISASEREKIDGENSHQTKNLLSIFSEIQINLTGGKNDGKVKESYFPFSKLSINPPIYPTEKENPSGYAELVDEFIDEYNNLTSLRTNFEASLLFLLQKYLWAVPSAYYFSKTDISLFEHLKTTAAIATALYREIGLEEPAKGKPYWLLVIGDISGIQKFIYTISSKGAAKGLKGRSFYLELLQRAVSRYLIDVLDLKEANIIYMGGGKIYLLAYASAEEILKEAERKINKFLIEKFGGELYFILGWEKLIAEDFVPPVSGKGNNISAIMERIFLKLEEKKGKRFGSLLKEEYAKFFVPTPQNISHEICSVCGKELTQEELKSLNLENEILKCKTCVEMERLGSAVKNMKWILEVRGEHEEETIFGFRFGDYSVDYIVIRDEGIYLPTKESIGFRINDTDFIKENIKETLDGGDIGFMFIGGSETFEGDEEAKKTFEDLVSKSESEGARKLGVFRADIDHLGKIFKDGLGDNISLARLSQLSFLLKYFFSGIINKIFKDSKIIYSGGDDLFVVGHWNKLLNEVSGFHRSFKSFVRNPSITLSGGFIYVNPSYPIYSFSEMAGEEEDKAKKGGRNRLSAFGVIVKWEDFYILKAIRDELKKALEDGLPKSYIQYLMRISGIASDEERLRGSGRINTIEKSIKLYRWKWHLVYHHARLKNRYNRHESLFKNIEKFLKNGEWNGTKLSEDEKAQKFIYLPARWVELEKRKEGSNE